ncbi:cbb3-type cytochrome c oxidase N-terminal domain-containing protein [Eisenibacter elegans]|uniref:cbb3-type cytochrome c oxidase N-terminal domain-containing protein n=1 Tax=Eisenibacter elegans TaxID=997 RepID=UPI000409BB15|nr:cbb3-type cytochrome c oxidase N-terminal domain-containing protein [Eisenibacter elegans]
MKPNLFSLTGLSLFGLLLTTLPTRAMSVEPATSAAPTLSTNEMMLLLAMSLVIVVAILVLIVALYAVVIIHKLLQKQNPDYSAANPSLLGSLWTSIDRQLTDAVPIEQEHTIVLDHNYDGIRELDNHLPPWWVYLFYVSLAFSLVYIAVFHIFDVFPLQDKEYEQQMAQAKVAVEAYKAQMANNIDESNVELIKDADVLANAKSIYDEECATCHGIAGEGGVGPNLTDEYWLHGGSIQDVFKTIKYGVPSKGMIAWEKKLKPDEMQAIASYILTLQGTNPPNAKDPQGEKYTPEAADDAEKISMK